MTWELTMMKGKRMTWEWLVRKDKYMAGEWPMLKKKFLTLEAMAARLPGDGQPVKDDVDEDEGGAAGKARAGPNRGSRFG